MMKKLLAILMLALTLMSAAFAYYPQGYGIQPTYNYGWNSWGGGYSVGNQIQATSWNNNYYGSPMYSRWQPYGGQYTGPSVIYSGPYSRVRPFQYGQQSYGWGGSYTVNPFATRPVIFW